MRKLLISLIAIAALGTGGAFAQSGYWAGISTGLPFGAVIHFGIEDLIATDVDLRVNLSGSYGRSGTVTISAFAIGADVLYRLNDLVQGTQPISPYAGGGVTVGLGGATDGVETVGVAVFDIHALAGAEYFFTQQWSAFLEGQLGFGRFGVATSAGAAGAASGLTYRIGLGVNYRF